MKPLRWLTDAESAAYMRQRKRQNLAKCVRNPNENWMRDKLATTVLKWSRQATWGYRLFDFFCHQLGVAIEVDGEEHDPDYDGYRDEYNFRRSGLVVLRVRNRNEDDADFVLKALAHLEPWQARRERLGLHRHTKKERRELANVDDARGLLGEFLAELRRLVEATSSGGPSAPTRAACTSGT